MKINFHYHFYSRILISLLIFAFGFFLLQKSIGTKALISNVYKNNTPIVGWAWNDKIGWVALNCANDFDGDGLPNGGLYADGTGWGSCATVINSVATSWGLYMSSSTVDHDNNPATPNIVKNYVKGCAWAGSTSDVSIDGYSAGWICFSDPGGTAANKDGVLMSQFSEDQSTCSCDLKFGTCEGPIQKNLCIDDGTKKYCSRDMIMDTCVGTAPNQYCVRDQNDRCVGTAPNKHCLLDPLDSCTIDTDCVSSCTSNADCLSLCNVDADCYPEDPMACTTYGVCSGTYGTQVNNYCQPSTHTCSISKNACDPVNHGNEDCQFACSSTASDFMAIGVCFDYTDYTVGQKQALLDNRGNFPPFTTITDPYMHSCYINKDCYDQNDSRNTGHSRGECVYPQYGLRGSATEGSGTCMVRTTNLPQSNGATCVYDFDCETGNYCALSLDSDVPNAPTSCELPMCSGPYHPVTTIIRAARYANALNPQSTDFASIVKMESVTTTSGYEQANHLGFPIKYQVGYLTQEVSTSYDADNPNHPDDNPLRGCFNCYQERVYRCALSAQSCSCDQSQGSCTDSVHCNTGESCVTVEQTPRCENCLEYFYYPTDREYQCLSGRSCSCNPSQDSCVSSDCNNNSDLCIIKTHSCEIAPDVVCIKDNPSSPNSINCGNGDCIYHEPGSFKKTLTGFNCSDCVIENVNNSCSLNSSGINNNRCSVCKVGGDSTVYHDGGVIYDNQHGRAATSTLCGWAYNEWRDVDTIGSPGFGWFNFSPLISTSTKPYFSVEKGSIYSKGRIVTRYQPPISKYNATYLIESSGNITNFVSKVSKTEQYQGELEGRPVFDFLALRNNKYRNALGKLDYGGLITPKTTASAVNKYGSVIEEVTVLPSGYADNSLFANPLNNRVLHITNVPYNYGYGVEFGDGADLEVKPGDATDPSGAGIIVVEGNMKIKRNIRYGSTIVDNIKKIPSLVWIVKGDVVIDASVTEVAGTFIILGDGQMHTEVPSGRNASDCSILDPSFSSVPQSYTGCGQFKSVYINGDGSAEHPGDNFLKVYGNIFARKFVLARTKIDQSSGTPAEQFINDGRLQSNPPLGLTEVSKVIPRFSSY